VKVERVLLTKLKKSKVFERGVENIKLCIPSARCMRPLKQWLRLKSTKDKIGLAAHEKEIVGVLR